MSEAFSNKDFAISRNAWRDQVLDDPGLNSTTRDVAFRIDRYFNRDDFLKDGTLCAWPSLERISNEVGCTSRTVQRSIILMKSRGHLETEGRGGRSVTLNFFAIVMPKNDAGKPDKPRHSRHETTTFETLNHDKRDTKPRHLRHENHDTSVVQKYIYKNINKNTHASTREREPVALPTRTVDVQCEPYSAEWALVVFEGLSRERARLPTPANKFLHQRIVVDRIHADVMEHQAKHGWPDINSMFGWPKALALASVPPAIRKMALEMEPVTAGSALWIEWREAFAVKGWPFPSEAKRMSFPLGGPVTLDAFMRKLIEARDQPPDNVVTLVNGNGS